MAGRSDKDRPIIHEKREGEVDLPFDPATRIDAGLTFIGHLETPWKQGSAPKNVGAAREGTAHAPVVRLRDGYATALLGLEVGQAIQMMYWVDRGQRDLAIQVPKHGRRLGTFALRSPVRPNPIALATVVITSLNPERGVVGIDAIDAWDGTPVLDIKPWIARVDVPPGWRDET